MSIQFLCEYRNTPQASKLTKERIFEDEVALKPTLDRFNGIIDLYATLFRDLSLPKDVIKDSLEFQTVNGEWLKLLDTKDVFKQLISVMKNRHLIHLRNIPKENPTLVTKMSEIQINKENSKDLANTNTFGFSDAGWEDHKEEKQEPEGNWEKKRNSSPDQSDNETKENLKTPKEDEIFSPQLIERKLEAPKQTDIFGDAWGSSAETKEEPGWVIDKKPSAQVDWLKESPKTETEDTNWAMPKQTSTATEDNWQSDPISALNDEKWDRSRSQEKAPSDWLSEKPQEETQQKRKASNSMNLEAEEWVPPTKSLNSDDAWESSAPAADDSNWSKSKQPAVNSDDNWGTLKTEQSEDKWDSGPTRSSSKNDMWESAPAKSAAYEEKWSPTPGRGSYDDKWDSGPSKPNFDDKWNSAKNYSNTEKWDNGHSSQNSRQKQDSFDDSWSKRPNERSYERQPSRYNERQRPEESWSQPPQRSRDSGDQWQNSWHEPKNDRYNDRRPQPSRDFERMNERNAFSHQTSRPAAFERAVYESQRQPRLDADVNVPSHSRALRSDRYTEERDVHLEKDLFYGGQHTGINFDKYDKIRVKVTGSNAPPAMQHFDSRLHPHLLENIKLCKYTKPTPVQKYAVPILLEGRDMMACAQTGSGKTAAYLVPIISICVQNQAYQFQTVQAGRIFPLVLIMAPTRELSCQIFDETRKFCYKTGIRSCVVYGGQPIIDQLEDLEKGCHILVGTPGRLKDFCERKKVSLSQIRFVVVDEADKMLEMGFEESIMKIFLQMSDISSKEKRQTLMFSATFPSQIQKMASEFLKPDYLFLAVGIVGSACENVKQEVIRVQDYQKKETLIELLKRIERKRVLIFCRSRKEVDRLDDHLFDFGFPCTSIHGERNQIQREKALESFKRGKTPILIATDVASRGLDIPDVHYVINYDFPSNMEDYVHRIGRTGRAGNTGQAVSFFSTSDFVKANELKHVLEESGQHVPAFLLEGGGFSSGASGPVNNSYNSDWGGKDYRHSTSYI